MKVSNLPIQPQPSSIRSDRLTQRTPADAYAQAERTAETVAIRPQPKQASSALAISAPKGSFSEFLTVDEQKALDMIFAKYNDPTRFGQAYNRDSTATTESSPVGRIIDVKV
ncbi:MAG: hypothetical protein AAB305_02170 [Candidatus Zixiibacteriota bacterium]